MYNVNITGACVRTYFFSNFILYTPDAAVSSMMLCIKIIYIRLGKLHTRAVIVGLEIDTAMPSPPHADIRIIRMYTSI